MAADMKCVARRALSEIPGTVILKYAPSEDMYFGNNRLQLLRAALRNA
jgi:hypothetical protein